MAVDMLQHMRTLTQELSHNLGWPLVPITATIKGESDMFWGIRP